MTVDLLIKNIPSPHYLGYLLYGERWLASSPRYSTIVDELLHLQRENGRSAFISMTTSIPCAYCGTGNQSSEDIRRRYYIYVVRVPKKIVIENPSQHYGLNEREYFVPDYILPEEIVASFPRDQKEQLFTYLQQLLGINREDVLL